MKLNKIRCSQLAVIGGLASWAACAPATQADGVTPGWYLSADGGLNMMQDFHFIHTDTKISTDAGMRWGLEGGYAFKLSEKLTLGTELESGMLWNSLSSVTRHGAETSLSGDFYQVPILCNLVLNYHVGKWVPYVGFGGGLDFVDANHNGSSTDFGPAAQVEGGLRYELCARTELGLGYKGLAAFSEAFKGSRPDMLLNHAVLLSLMYHF